MSATGVRTVEWIVTDLDGTLVGRDLRIVEPNLAALRRFTDAGGSVVVATGRGEESALPYYRELGLATPAILYNGARVVDLASGAVLYRRCLSVAAWARLTLLFDELPAGVWPVVFSDGRAHVLADSAALREYARRDRIGLVRIGSWGELPLDEIIKVMLICERPAQVGAAEAVLAGFAGVLGSGVTLVRSESTYLEVLPAGATKGTALRELAAAQGVPMERVAAIGDNPNDLDMIQAAGLGAAVGDGDEGVRAAADIVVADCALGAVADLVDRVMPRP
ncbi:Cof-type HAD-IIB family hydrolase [Actinomadura macrotermitis]|uniref:Pyridoxal phosphate phosphatase YbhA n=1 Tax=Actinomadura macrotermitis TaxID=2585200 RepID=A0A7K0C2M4_9ACTN|nr:Cof-type HAD-IIB family hydrolase [Actinomadura macrotermitis]MQY07681.1 Pyridoxal phosphate phosphatase YbhA [Actinomadura macrotermitis]